MNKYYNENLDVTATVNGKNFSLLGNRENEVKDNDIFDMIDGNTPEGWVLA